MLLPLLLLLLKEAHVSTTVAGLFAATSWLGVFLVTPFASPRRLAVHVTGVAAKAADKAVQQKLMPVAVALNADGQPTLLWCALLVDFLSDVR